FMFQLQPTSLFLFSLLSPPISTLFPYTTLFRSKIESHTFICDEVEIEDEVFIGHGTLFVNDKFPRATNTSGVPKTEAEWTKSVRSEEHTSELQSRGHLVCRLLLEKTKSDILTQN